MARQLADLLGPRPGQHRRRMGRIREGRFLRAGTRPLSHDHKIWPVRIRLVILPGRILYVAGHA